MGMPFNDGNATVVAKMQLEVKVALYVFCTADESGLCFSYVSFGASPLSHEQMCTQPFARRNGEIKMKMTWFSDENDMVFTLK